MSNYTTIFTGKDGDKRGSDVIITQNSILNDLTFSCYFEDGTDYTFSVGDTMTGFFQDKADTDSVYGIAGTLTPAEGANTFTWTRDATDTGQPGDYALAFKVVSSGADPDYSILVSYKIIASPDGVLVPALPLVGVTATEAAWLTLALATVPDASDLVSSTDLATKQDKDTDAVAGNAAMMDADGQAVDAGTAFGALETTTGSQTKADEAQAAAIAALGGADDTATDEQLRNWSGQVPESMTSITTTDYSKSYTAVNGVLKYAGSKHITGTVTWPDGVTGHIDGVEYPEQPGVLQYFTASHVASGKITIKHPLMFGVNFIGVITPDYYVDSNAAAGGDGSLATPFNSLLDLSLSANDIIAIKSGGTWRENFDAVAGLSMYRYGAGEKPIIDGADIITGTWTNDGVYTNLWYIDVSPDEIGVTDIDTNLWIDGEYPSAGQAADLATCNTTDDSFFVDDDLAATQRIYYNPTTSNPNDDGRLYEFNSRTECINGTDIANLVIDGIITQRQRSPSGSTITGRTANLSHCEFHDGTKHNLYIRDGSTMYGCVFDGALWDGTAATLTVYNEATPASLGISFYDSAWTKPTYSSGFVGAFGHYNTSGDFGEVLYKNCYFNNCSAGVKVGSGGATTLTIDSCVQANAASLSGFAADPGMTIIIKNNITSGGANAQSLLGSTVDNTYTIRNNYISGVGANPCVIQIGGAGTFFIHDNEFSCSASVTGTISQRRGIRWDDGATATVTHYRNKYFGSLDGSGSDDFGVYYYSLVTPQPTFKTDYNEFGNGGRTARLDNGSFNAVMTTLNGTAVTGVTDTDGTPGDGEQEGNSLIFT